jgi:hypothetical protein
VDNNPAENALLELKIAAIKHLNYEDYLLILGEKEDTGLKRFTCDILQLTLIYIAPIIVQYTFVCM